MVWRQFANTLKTEKAKGDYFALVKDLCQFTGKDMLEIGPDDARAYADVLAKKRAEGKLAQSTVNVRMARLHSVYRFLAEDYLETGMMDNPFSLVVVPQISEQIPEDKIPKPEELDRILAYAKSNPQLHVAVSMVIRCGFTVGELCSIRRDALIEDARGNHGVRFTYRNIERWVKLPDDVTSLIDGFVCKEAIMSEYLFSNKKGNQLRIRDLERLYKKYVLDNMDQQYTLQDLRNAAVVYMLKGGASSGMVADYINIDYGWMHRYNTAVSKLELAAVDFSNIRIVGTAGE